MEALVIPKKKKEKGEKTRVGVSRRKRENYALVSCTSLRIVTKRDSARSFDPYPAAKNKILHNPDISRIGLHFATLSLKARTTGPACLALAYLWNEKKKRKRRKRGVHARVYTCSKFAPFGTFAKKWYEEWSNYATYCRTATLLSASYMLAHREKSFSIDDGRIVSTIEPLFVLLSFLFFFFFFVGQKELARYYVRSTLILVYLQFADNSEVKNIEWR